MKTCLMGIVCVCAATFYSVNSAAEEVTAHGLWVYYRSQPEIGTTRTSEELTSADVLADIDLLVLDIAFGNSSPYDSAELAVISDFVNGGKDVALIAEGFENLSHIGVEIDSYNALLADIGASISYESSARSGAGPHLADTILNTPLTAGVSQFQMAAANNLLGGTPAIQHDAFTVVAFEQIGSQAGTLTVFSDVDMWNPIPLPTGNDQLALNMLAGGTNVLISTQIGTFVPVPPALYLFASGLIGLVGVARQKVS